MTSVAPPSSLRRPTSRQVAEAYADAQILAKERNCYVVVLWRDGEMIVDALEPGHTPEDYPAAVGHSLTILYPWCRESGVACLDLWPQLSRADIVKLALESGLAEQWIDLVCREIG